MGDTERYLFLASAVAGRRLSVHRSCGSELLAFSDGQSIVLPRLAADDVRGKSEDEPGDWADIIGQAMLVAAGSFEPSIVRQMILRGGAMLRRRYLYLEVLRASFLVADRLPMCFARLPELKNAVPLTDSAAQSLAYALGPKPLPEPPVYFGELRPFATLRRHEHQEGVAALTRKQRDGNMQFARQRELSDEEEDEAESSALLKLLQNPFAASNPLSEMLNKILGAGTSRNKQKSSEDGQGGSELPIGRIERVLRRGVHAVLSKLPIDIPEIDRLAEPASLTYPEWDTHSERYRQDWVFVEIVDPWRPDGPRDVTGLLQMPSMTLRRQLASLGLDHQMHRRQADGSDIDASALLECAIDLRTGHSPAALNVFRATRKTRRDLAVAIVVDISGSTGERSGDGDSVFDKQLRLAYQLGCALDTFGDAVAMFGFHSWGRKLVRVVRLKGHEERWSGLVSERISHLEPIGYTRVGTAIRHGIKVLNDDMRLPNRLLVLITDGIAYDQDYERSYAEGDARKALQEARARGAACVCINLGSSLESAQLNDIFGAANILAVDDVSQAIGRIRQVCRTALLSVVKRRYQSEGGAARAVPV